MIEINSFEDFFNNADKLPTSVLKDIDKRIGDWLSAGGSWENPYVKQQFKYAERILNR